MSPKTKVEDLPDWWIHPRDSVVVEVKARGIVI
jgi:ATP-dependent DNA ligase